MLDDILYDATTLLLSVALILRVSGAAIRIGYPRLFPRTLGWVFCTTAAWAAAAAIGAWFPLWPALGLGVLGSFVTFRMNRHELWSAADVIVVLMSGLLSIPPVMIGLLGVTIVLVAGTGLATDLLMVRSPRQVRISAILLPFVASGAVMSFVPETFVSHIGVTKPLTLQRAFRLLQKKVPYNRLVHIGLIPTQNAQRIVLKTGAVAWLDQPPGKGPFPGALFFHGADPKGSRQSSAIVVRRALLDAGFVVLSVDHIGYGESQIPSRESDVSAWDPLPTDIAALTRLRSLINVDRKRIFVLGHSMGTYEVFRMLRAQPDFQGAAVFGAALNDPKERDEYWYKRFHSDRRMRTRISRELFYEIRGRFYDNLKTVQILDPNHVPVLFIRFGLEWPYLAATRDILYGAIPGRKTLWDLPNSSHYFNSYRITDLIIGDTTIGRSLSARFRVLGGQANRGSLP